MGIFKGLFRSRDKPTNSYDSPSYSYFFGRTVVSESMTVPPCSTQWYMPA